MFFKIIRRDLRRKKSMNIILFLFMVMIGMLVAGSTNLMYTVTNALDDFLIQSNAADFIAVSLSDETSDLNIEAWAQNNPLINQMEYTNSLMLTSKNMEIPEAYGEYKEATMMVITTQSKELSKVFDQEDQLLQVNDGEIAIPVFIADRSGLKLGDQMAITIGDQKVNVKVKYFVKDVTFGAGMMGFKRIILSEGDYQKLSQSEIAVPVRIWSIKKAEGTKTEDIPKSFYKIPVSSIIASITQQTIRDTYLMDLMLAAIMVIVSIFLMLISLLILRFTLLFTLQEDYKEIGIMKAIGLKNRRIGNLYLLKYFFLACLGTSIGLLLSVPFSNKMLKGIARNIVIDTSRFAFVLSLISVVVVLVITLLFCTICTRRIQKFSAIDAIRNGTTGERFSKRTKISLYKRHRLSVPIYMAISDLLNEWKKFIILAITFTFGTILIISPINVINTLNSSEIVQAIGFPKADFFLNVGDFTQIIQNVELSQFEGELDQAQKQYRDAGEQVDVHYATTYAVKIYIDSEEESGAVNAMKAMDFSTDAFNYIEGKAPKLINEIAITETLMKTYKVGIGDTIHCVIGDKTYDCIITATFQSMFNMGKSIRLSDAMIMDFTGCNGLFVFGNISDSKNMDESIKSMQVSTPQYEVKSAKNYVMNMMGSIDQQLNVMRNIILTFVLSIIFLITVLLVKMFISRETSEIAILKSMGFRDAAVKSWQMIRIGIVLVFSVALGAFLANQFGYLLTDGIFNYMGATRMQLRIISLEVYCFYPLVILSVTMLAVLMSLGQINRIKVWETNNQE